MARRRGGGSIGDMLRTVGVFAVLIGAIVALRSGGRQERSPVVRVDDALVAELEAARSAGLPALGPVGLPAAWAPTSARFARQDPALGGRPLLHAGFVTPGGAFAALEQSTGDVSPALDPVDGTGPAPAGSVAVGDRVAELTRSREGIATLTLRTSAGVVVAASGGADERELAELLAALR